jgi:hypothetical protein
VLDPGAATHAGQIVAAESFGDDALQTMVPRRCQHPLGVADEVPRRPPADAVIEPEFEQQLAPALVGKLARRAAIEMEQIEREIGDWPALSVPAGLVGRGAQPPPQACEVGAAVGCQADELAVEQHPVAAERGLDGRELGELLGAVAPWPRAQAHGAPVTTQLETHPIELHLEGPAVAGGHGSGVREHGGDESGKLLSRGHAARVGEPRGRRGGLPLRVPIGKRSSDGDAPGSRGDAAEAAVGAERGPPRTATSSPSGAFAQA